MTAMPVEAFTIRQAAAEDLPFIMALQRRNRESLGGLPSPAIEERILRRSLLLGSINGEPCGYLLYDYRAGILRIPQACIQYDARRRYYGEQLLGVLLNAHPGYTEIRLRCAADLEANVFWQAMGFICVGVVPGGTRRNRLLNMWQKWAASAHLFTPDEFETPPAWQQREDCLDAETGFLDAAPVGFEDRGSLGRLAWSNRKAPS